MTENVSKLSEVISVCFLFIGDHMRSVTTSWIFVGTCCPGAGGQTLAAQRCAFYGNVLARQIAFYSSIPKHGGGVGFLDFTAAPNNWEYVLKGGCIVKKKKKSCCEVWGFPTRTAKKKEQSRKKERKIWCPGRLFVCFSTTRGSTTNLL